MKAKLLIGALLYKHGAMSFTALTMSLSLSFINLQDSYFGLSLALILILSILIFLDSFTGILASRFEGEKVQSGKLMFTFYKFLMAFLFFWLLDSLQDKLHLKITEFNSSYMGYFYKSAKEAIEIISYSVFTLLSLREWLSIGENIERRYNKKFYLFTIIEKIFDIVESKLLKWLGTTKLCTVKDNENSSEV